MKKWFLYSLISILVVGLLSACGTSGNDGQATGAKGDSEGDSEKKVLKMGTSSDYPPFEYVDTNVSEEIIGFDIDLANAIAEELGYELQVQDIDFASLITAMNAGNIDLILSGMTPTPEREQQVDFTDIYYTAHNIIVSLKESDIETLEDLEGKTLGVQLGSIQEEEAEKIAEEVDINIENRDRIPQLIQELKIGRIDAAIIEDTVIKGYFEKDADLTGFQLDTEEGGSAIALPKDSELTEEFNRVLNEMKENGELEKLILKWFDSEEE